MERLLERLRKTQMIYAAHGFTTVQDGIAVPSALALYQEAGAKRELILDIVALPGSEMADALISGAKARPFGVYKNHWKLGGIVMTADSAPQERTALVAVWTAVNRDSRSNVVIGPDERVTPLEALRAMTANGAYQYFEENTKGSLEPGKLADLVILDKNPLTIDPMAIKDIKVVETIKEGKSIYSAK